MINHIVLLDMPSAHDRAELSAVMNGIDALRASISGFTHFEHGPNRDFERMSQDCRYAFMCRFDDVVAAQAYLENPDHIALGKRLVALCNGGPSGIRVIDMDVSV